MFTPEEIIQAIKEGKRKKIRVYPQHACRASEIGHPCERYLVYSITNWQDRAPFPPEVQFIFDGGNAIEELAVKDLEGAGFKIYRPEPDKAIMESRPRITGNFDIRVDFGDSKIYTGEIKGLNKHDFDRLNTIQDFFNSKKPWIKKYPAQLMTYLYIKGEERGFFYLKSIPAFQPKFIWVDLDFDYMDSILKKTERVENHVFSGTLPNPIHYDDLVCGYCGFAHICLSPVERKELVFIDDPEFSDKLNRRAELAAIAKEYNDLDEEIKNYLKVKQISKATIGNYLITGKQINKNMPAKEAYPVSCWQSTIKKI